MKNIMKKARLKGILKIILCVVVVLQDYDAGILEQVIQDTTGHQSSDGNKAYKCTPSMLDRKASELLQGTFSEAEMEEECRKGARNLCKVFNES